MKVKRHNSKWILLDNPKPECETRLFCFPYAGGGASTYSTWNNIFPGSIEVCPIQLPGREDRIREPFYEDISPLIEAIFEEIKPWLDKQFAFFGHCMGAKIAFELTLQIAKLGYTPICVFVSGCEAPHIPEKMPLYDLPEEDFKKGLIRLGTARAIVENKELMDIFIPLLRKDFFIGDTYLTTAGTKINCPITAFCGSDDPKAKKDDVVHWKENTNNEFRMYEILGNHLFVNSAKDELSQLICRELRR